MTRSSIRDGAFIVGAVALPVVVAAVFVLASAVPDWYVDAPQFPVLITVPVREHNDFGIRYERVDGRVVAEVSHVGPTRHQQHQALYRFDPGTAQLTDVSLPITQEVRGALLRMYQGEPVSMPLPLGETMTNMRLHTGVKSPDGYALYVPPQRSAGLLGEVFGFRQRRRVAGLEKDGRIIDIPFPTEPYNGYYRPLRVIGWILP